MAVERKAYWLRHLILIIIVIIVLFPIAWLVNTSIRRDEAAFSPNLFSSRVTFQHYKNLLFPQSSVGRLVIDIQSAVYQTGDYSDKSEEEITGIVQNYIDKYDELTEKSVKISESINSELENLRKAIDNNIYPNMIESINIIREKDIELLNERISQLDIDTNSPYFIAAVGKTLLSYDNWNTDTFKYLLSEFGSVGEEIFNKIENFDNSLNKLKKNETELFEKVSKMEFDEKNDVLKSISNTPLYYDPFDYTEWRKIEWLKIINKFLKDIDDEELQVIKSNFYDSFKEARDNFEIVNQSIEELNTEVQKLIENSYTDKTKNYLDAVVSLEDINSSLENLYKSLNSDREARKEIIDGLSVADPVIAPETEKLEILKNTTEKSLTKNYPVLDSVVEPDKIFNSIQNQNHSINNMLQNINALEITKTISILSELEKIRDLYDWFLENARNISSIPENSDIKNTLKILDASYSNLSRILPSFENTIDDLVSIESKIGNYLIDIERLEKQKADYEKTIEENEYYALNEIDNLSKAEELVNILVVKNIAKNEFSDSVTVNSYIKEISPLIELFTEEKPKKRYNDYYWYSNAEEAYINGTEGSMILKSTIDNMNIYMSSLKENVYDYIKLKFLKSPVSIDEFTELQNEFNTGYQLFNAKYQRASRLISDMLDFPPSYSTEISGSLK
ncbi:MAG: maltose/maltodextrin transport system permease protein, partial [Kosmotogales bacterium]|nr:maltose/maltodextrin transport system permease protein [Kosmotogales bacterium]